MRSEGYSSLSVGLFVCLSTLCCPQSRFKCYFKALRVLQIACLRNASCKIYDIKHFCSRVIGEKSFFTISSIGHLFKPIPACDTAIFQHSAQRARACHVLFTILVFVPTFTQYRIKIFAPFFQGHSSLQGPFQMFVYTTKPPRVLHLST